MTTPGQQPFQVPSTTDESDDFRATSVVTPPLATGRVFLVREDETIVELDQAIDLIPGEVVMLHAETRGGFALSDSRAVATGVVANMRRVRVARRWAREGVRVWLRRPSR